MRILVVEDNEGDQMLVKEAFKRFNSAVELLFVDNVDSALALLQTEKPDRENSDPKFIFLDLNLPKKSGKELLRAVKGDRRLKTIPVLVLTSSTAEADVSECYELGTNCYLKKPMKFADFCEMIESVYRFWVKQVAYAALGRNGETSVTAN